MSMARIKNSENIDALLKNGHWEIDKEAEFPVFNSSFKLKIALQNPNGFAHRFKETFYAVSCARHLNYDNKLIIELFEVNKPFRNEGIGRFALYELLKYYEPNITTVELYSISPESDKFFEHLKMQKKGFTEFFGDEIWLSNFVKSMTNENKNDVNKTIESIRNRLCD